LAVAVAVGTPLSRFLVADAAAGDGDRSK